MTPEGDDRRSSSSSDGSGSFLGFLATADDPADAPSPLPGDGASERRSKDEPLCNGNGSGVPAQDGADLRDGDANPLSNQGEDRTQSPSPILRGDDDRERNKNRHTTYAIDALDHGRHLQTEFSSLTAGRADDGGACNENRHTTFSMDALPTKGRVEEDDGDDGWAENDKSDRSELLPPNEGDDGRGEYKSRNTTAKYKSRHATFILLDHNNELPLDSFSMMFVARSLAEAFLPAAVFAVQITILILIVVNLLQKSDRPLATRMNVPVDTPPAVKASQYLACMVSVFTADDLVSGAIHVGQRVVKKSRVGRDAIMAATDRRITERVEDLQRQIADANQSKWRRWGWEIVNSMRILEGALVVITSFIFIAQSYSAIDLWLNFAAVQFVGLLDDTTFLLAKNRFLGTTARNLTYRVSDYEVYREGDKKIQKVRRIRLAIFVGIGLGMWAGLTVFVFNQTSLQYACSSITVTIGSDRHQHARHFTGRYTIQKEKINGRAVYVQVQGRGAFVAYCAENEINRWTVSRLFKDEPKDPCANILLESQRTRSLDITDIGDELMFWTGEDADARIKCNQCNPKRNASDCSFRGTCEPETKLCNCSPGFFGEACQFKGPCTEMRMHDEFHGIHSGTYQKEWDLMYLDGSPLMVYDRPVYVQNIGEGHLFDVILYDGGHWFVSESDDFDDWFQSYSWGERAELSLANYLSSSFNARDSKYHATYISAEPSSLAAPNNIPFKVLLAEGSDEHIGKLGEEEYELLCADCDDGESGVSYCDNAWGEHDYGICKATENELHGVVNRCECPSGFGGPLCRLRPVEGTISLHLDHASGMCSTCYEGNPWMLWDMGTGITCKSMGKLIFEGDDTFSRYIGLHLNSSHFSVFVSANDDAQDTMCLGKDGSKEVYTIRRYGTDERIIVNVAIHLDNRTDVLGEVIKPEEILCLASTEIDHDVCHDMLFEGKPGTTPSLLQQAWLLLDLKITPSTAAAEEQINDLIASAPNPTESNPAQAPYPGIFSNNGAANVAGSIAERYTFALIPKSTSNSFFDSVKSGCMDRAAALSRPSVRGSIVVECLFVGPRLENATEQFEIVKDLINNGNIDGIAMSVPDQALAAEAVDMAFAAGIPFITFDSDAPATKRTAYVGTDNFALGKEMAMLLLTRFATSGSYAIITGNSPNLVLRAKGIRHVLNSNNWMEVTDSPIFIDMDDPERTVEQVRDLLNNHPDVTSIMATLGYITNVFDQSIWATFASEHPDLIKLSADAMPKQVNLLNMGYLNGLVAQQPVDMGSKSIDTLLSLAKGNEVEEFVATSMVVMGRVNEGTPYTELSSSAIRKLGPTRSSLWLFLSILVLLAMLSI